MFKGMITFFVLWVIVTIILHFINTWKKVDEKEEYAIQKGKDGEQRIKNILLSIQGVKALQNLYIPTGKGYSEIDLVALKNGIGFVVESKNYSCKVKGSSRDEYWSLEYSNGKIYQMYNPIMQNDRHMQILGNLFRVNPKELFYSVVVFSDNADISNVKNDRKDIIFCNERDLKNKILLELKNHKEDKQKTEKLFTVLSRFGNVSEKVKGEHIKNIKRYKKKIKR